MKTTSEKIKGISKIYRAVEKRGFLAFPAPNQIDQPKAVDFLLKNLSGFQARNRVGLERDIFVVDLKDGRWAITFKDYNCQKKEKERVSKVQMR